MALFAPMAVEVNGKRMVLAEVVVMERHQPPPRVEYCATCGTTNPKTHACPSCVRYVTSPEVTTAKPHMMAFDPETGLPLWNLPIAISSGTSYAVQGQYLVVANHGANIYSLTNGELATTVSVPDSYIVVCATHEDRVLLYPSGVFDHGALSIEIGSMTLSPAPVPDSCAHSDRRVLVSPDATNTVSVRDVAADDRHYGSSQTPRALLTEGENAVLLGLRADGHHVPVLVGLDPASKRERWRALVPAEHPEAIASSWMGLHVYDVRDANRVLALSDGRAIVEYGDWLDRPRLAAFDARTGRRLWDVELPDREFQAFSAGFGHIYSYDKDLILRILNASTGEAST